MSSLFDFLKTELRARDWSMTDLARRAGCSKQIVSQWLAENEAERITPGPASCRKLADALGVDPDYMLVLAGHRKPRPEQALPDEAELTASKFIGALRDVPRQFWAAVVDASVALANAYADAPGSPEGSVSERPVPPVSDPRDFTNKRRRSTDKPLGNSKHSALVLIGAT